MRLIRLTVIAAIVAALATVPTEAVRPYQLRRVYEFPMDHQSGGITCSDTRFFTGTDTGTMEERSHDGHLLDVRNEYQTGSGTAFFSNATNRLGSFSQLSLGVTNDVFYFCSEDDNAVYKYTTGVNTMTRVAGNGQAGLLAGGGTAARIDCGNTAVQSARDDAKTKVFMFSGRPGASNYAIVSIAVTAATGAEGGVLSIVAGSGVGGHADGTGVAAQIGDLHGMLYYKDSISTKDYLIMTFSDSQGPIRYLDIATTAIATSAIVYDANAHVTGSNGQARIPYVLGLVNVPGQPFGFGITSASRVFTLSWQRTLGSFSVVFNPTPLSGKWGAAIRPDGRRVFFGNNIPGNGTLARFEAWPMTITKTPPPTRTHTSTITPPSKTHPETRTASISLPAKPTPAPTPNPTPVPTNAPGSGVTTLAPGSTTNTTIDSAASASLFLAGAVSALLLAILG